MWQLGNYRYLSSVPPIGRVWHKAFFRWVQTQGRSPHTPGGSKISSHPVGIALKGVPQAPDDRINPSKEGQNLERRHPEARGYRSIHASTNCHWNQDTPDQIRAPLNAADWSASQPGALHGGIFVTASHQTGLDTRLMAQELYIVGIRGGEGQAWAEARSLLDFIGHRPT